jgi:hypothetical protein
MSNHESPERPARSRLYLLLAPLLAASAAEAKSTKKPAAVPLRGEQAEIESVLRELEYLRERVQALQGKYGRATGNAKIRFNYPACIEQLRVTEGNIRDFLNARIDVITTTPPQPVKGNLHFVRPN